MAHPARVKAAARAAYVFENMPLERIADAHGIPFATLRLWKRKARDAGDDWEKLRAANLLSGEGVESVARQMVAEYVMQHKALMDDVLKSADIPPDKKVAALASLADSFNKMVAASKRVLPETSEFAIALRVVRLLSEFVRDKFPEHSQALVEVLEPFGAELARKLGHKD